jgi:hypothetical protein
LGHDVTTILPVVFAFNNGTILVDMSAGNTTQTGIQALHRLDYTPVPEVISVTGLDSPVVTGMQSAAHVMAIFRRELLPDSLEFLQYDRNEQFSVKHFRWELFLVVTRPSMSVY